MAEVRDGGADLGIAFDGDADRCFFIDERGQFIDGDFLTALLAQSLLEPTPAEAILYDVRASRAVADTVAAAGGTRLPNRVGHAFFKTADARGGLAVRRRGLGPLLLPRLLLRGLGTLPALLMLELRARRPPLSELLRPIASATSSPARSTARSQTRGQDGGDRRALPRRASRTRSTGSRSTTPTGTSTCALQHRAAAAAVPRVAGLAGGHGAPPRRGARGDPLLTGAKPRY